MIFFDHKLPFWKSVSPVSTIPRGLGNVIVAYHWADLVPFSWSLTVQSTPSLDDHSSSGHNPFSLHVEGRFRVRISPRSSDHGWAGTTPLLTPFSKYPWIQVINYLFSDKYHIKLGPIMSALRVEYLLVKISHRNQYQLGIGNLIPVPQVMLVNMTSLHYIIPYKSDEKLLISWEILLNNIFAGV